MSKVSPRFQNNAEFILYNLSVIIIMSEIFIFEPYRGVHINWHFIITQGLHFADIFKWHFGQI